MLDKIKRIIENYEPQIYGEQKNAAVLLPLIQVDDEWHILYEVRSKIVSQSGDSSFPGGRVEAGETFKEAAIRETMEELNLKRNNIHVFGEIDYIVSQHVTIRCFVGELVDVKVSEIEPNVEVERIYTVPLSYFLNTEPAYFSVNYDPIFDENFLKEQEDGESKYELTNFDHHIPYYDIDDHLLWGFTANLTSRFIEIIRKEISI